MLRYGGDNELVDNSTKKIYVQGKLRIVIGKSKFSGFFGIILSKKISRWLKKNLRLTGLLDLCFEF